MTDIESEDDSLRRRNIIACVWDFDKTLIPGYMQSPLFEEYGIDEKTFWREVNLLPDIYRRRGLNVSKDTIYLNHLLSYVKNGPLKGLSNARLRELGARLAFYPGLPEFFQKLKALVQTNPAWAHLEITLEHYVISTGLAEMIRGSAIAPLVDGIYGCEFVEHPLPPHFSRQDELALERDTEISQIGVMVDNTIKTRFVFEINKGVNKHPEIDVNAMIRHEDRRVPLRNMIYIADGPSDVPVFSVIKRSGGKAYAVYSPDNPEEFAQNDSLLQVGRIHAYGPADYRDTSSTALWIKMHVEQICQRIAQERQAALASRIAQPPRHLHKPEVTPPPPPAHQQPDLL
jgi:hypothetical protein